MDYHLDLFAEIEKLTCAPLGHRLKMLDKIGKEYRLWKTTIARYLCIRKMNSKHSHRKAI